MSLSSSILIGFAYQRVEAHEVPADEIGNEIEDLSLPISQMQRASNIFHDRQSLAHAFSIPALRWLCNGRMMF